MRKGILWSMTTLGDRNEEEKAQTQSGAGPNLKKTCSFDQFCVEIQPCLPIFYNRFQLNITK
jgi:hypothetical protein